MQRVQPVQLRLKLQAQLHFLLVRTDVLVDLLLKFDSKLDFVFQALPNIAVSFLKLIEFHLQILFVRIQLPDLKVKVLLHLGQCFLMLRVHLCELHLIAAPAAILKQDGIYLPD